MNTRLTYQIIAGILLLAVLVLWAQSFQNSKEKNRLLTQVQLNATELEKTRNKLGEEVSTFKAFQLSADEMKRINDSTIQSLKSTVRYFRTLASHTGVTSTTSGTVSMPAGDSTVVRHDTAYRAKTWRYNDPWIDIDGLLLNDTAYLAYKVTNRLSIDYYWKRAHWWNRPELFGSVTQSNPHTTTDRVVQFTVTAPPPAWYQKWWVNMLIGAGAGATATYILSH